MKQKLIADLSANDGTIGDQLYSVLLLNDSADCVLPSIAFCSVRDNNNCKTTIVASAELVLEWHSSEKYDLLLNL